MTKREIHVATVAKILRAVEEQDLDDTDVPICDEVHCHECPLYGLKKDKFDNIDLECLVTVKDARDWWFRNIIERNV